MKVKIWSNSIDKSWSYGEHDLPCCTAVSRFSVSNEGNKSALDVTISVFVDGTLISSVTKDLAICETYWDSTETVLDYDESCALRVEASSLGDTSSHECNISARFPRSMPLKLARLYITPDDPVVRRLRNEIVGDQKNHWKALRDWVGSNIEYENDAQQFGSGDYWMLSRELICSGKGDCEDQAILLCSLLRADGWRPDEVFVIIEDPDGEGMHAWVSLKIADMFGMPVWVNLESAAGEMGLGGYMDFRSLKIPDRIYAFNDKYFLDFS